jgi:hypothetical protein
VVIVVLVAYPLSFGPACWIAGPAGAEQGVFTKVYWPVGWVADHAPRTVQKAIVCYALLGIPKGVTLSLPVKKAEYVPISSRSSDKSF